MNIAIIEDDWTEIEFEPEVIYEINEFISYENELFTNYIIIFTDEMLDEI